MLKGSKRHLLTTEAPPSSLSPLFPASLFRPRRGMAKASRSRVDAGLGRSSLGRNSLNMGPRAPLASRGSQGFPWAYSGDLSVTQWFRPVQNMQYKTCQFRISQISNISLFFQCDITCERIWCIRNPFGFISVAWRGAAQLAARGWRDEWLARWVTGRRPRAPGHALARTRRQRRPLALAVPRRQRVRARLR